MKKQTELSPREAARRLGIRLDALYSLLWAGRMSARKKDGRWYIPVGAVQARLKQREVA